MQELPENSNVRAVSVLPRGGPAGQSMALTETQHGGYAQDADSAQDAGGLIEYWRMVRRRKGTLFLIASIGTVLGVLATLPQTPIYQARAALEIQDINPDYVNLRQQNNGSETGSITNALADIQTQIKILQSETLTERTLAKMKLKPTESPKEQPDRVVLWRKLLGLPQPAKPNADSELRASLANLKARAAGQTRIVEILYDSANPKFAAEFVNTLSNEFIEQNVEARWQMMQRTGDWLTKQLDDVKIRLERSEDALQAYARQSGLMFTGGVDKQNVSEEKLRQLQSQLSTAQGERISKQSRYEMAKNSPAEALPDVLNDLSLRDYQTKLTDLRRQQAEMTATYKPEYSKVKRIDAQIVPLEAALERERQAILVRIKNDFAEAKRRERLLSDDYAAQSRLVSHDAEKSIQYNILKREVDTNRQIYEAMLQRVKESSITSAMRASNVRVVDPAKEASRPYKPDTTMNAGLGMLAGLFLGVAFVVMSERANRTLQEPGDAAYYLNVPELGIIPNATALSRTTLNYFRRQSQIEGGSDDSAATGEVYALSKAPAVAERVELISWQRKPSMVAEAFRVVLTSLLFSGNDGNRPKVLVLTSASPSEGKSTVVSNLGIALTEIKQKTLIIDADLRKPRMHRIFDLPNEKGVTDLLKERTITDELMVGMVQETSIPGLFVLTAGSPTTAAANLLYSSSFPELVARFRLEYDMVLIDTPPMLQMPDARVAARAADAVIIVARANRTTRDAALAVRQRFAEDRTRVIGTILNDWNPKNSPNGYYGYYTGYYGKYAGYYGKN